MNCLWTKKLCALSLGGAALLFFATAPANAQKKKKTPPPPADASSVLPLPDEQQVDYTISEMLGAWQLGDVERMHKDYADDVTIVNGIYAPPVFGWSNFLALYQQQRTHLQRIRLDRSNTYIKVDGNVAWVCYQWDFAATFDDRGTTAQGLTTLVLQKRNNHWVIVLNHTSLAPGGPEPSSPASTPKAEQPEKPPSR
jgi:ketosteroid isomerase-like protein